MSVLRFRRAEPDDLGLVTDLLSRLYEGDNPEEIREDNRKIMASDHELILLASLGGTPVGLAHFAVRHEHVEGGTKGAPAGYLEAIYILPQFRHRGIARRLVLQLESWSREKGCKLLASDCDLDNLESQRFHQKTGFREVSRTVHFVKALDQR